MRNDLELLELVDRYLDGTLDTTARAAFERRLGTEPELGAMLADQRNLREGLERLALRPAVAKAYRAHRFGKWKPWLGGASVMIVVTVAGWTLWNAMPQERQNTPTIEEILPQPVPTPGAALQDTTEHTIRSTSDTVIDTVYRVLENGKWRTVKERPEGAQVMHDSTALSTNVTSTQGPTKELGIVSRSPLPVRIEPVETKPEFPGGMNAFYNYLEASIKHPDLTRPLSGTVEVGFTISADGQVENVEVVKGLDPAYNAEALRVIRSMPRWKPAQENGKAVPCRLQMPMQFKNPGVGSEP